MHMQANLPLLLCPLYALRQEQLLLLPDLASLLPSLHPQRYNCVRKTAFIVQTLMYLTAALRALLSCARSCCCCCRT